MADTNVARNPVNVTIAPQAEVYRGIQIYHDQRGYWFATPRGKVERSQNIERIRRSIDIVQMVLSTSTSTSTSICKGCKP